MTADEATVVSIDWPSMRAVITLVRSPGTRLTARIMEGLHIPPKRPEDAVRDPQGQTGTDQSGATWLSPDVDISTYSHYHDHDHPYGRPLAAGERVLIVYLSGRGDSPVIIGRI